MSNQRLYTSVGYLRLRQTKDGQYPVVVLNRREQLLEPGEMLLWSRLCWRFRDRVRTLREYEAAARDVSLPVQQGEFDKALDRLMARGLIAEGAGDTQVEALYDLMSNLYVAPLDNRFLPRLAGASRLALMRRIPCSAAKKLLQKDEATDQERRILALTRQARLSTAELIKCEEVDVGRVTGEGQLMEVLYYDDETTCYNIAHLMRQSEKRDAVILAVANLYLRKQIIFQGSC